MLQTLKPGDSVEIIAPASRCPIEHLQDLKVLLESWGLNCILDEKIFGDDLLCANNDALRFQLLKNALYRKESKAVICARGGYGSMRLLPALSLLTKPLMPKIVVGMSDITALHLFLQQKWQWPVILGALAKDKFSSESIAAVKALLFGEVNTVTFDVTPLNKHAEIEQRIEAPLTGGNLCLVQTSLGTSWQIESNKKIIFLEEINERGYRVDRMLEQLQQAGVFSEAAAIVFGDFLGGDEPDGTNLIERVLERFAGTACMPVLRIKGIGHGFVNFPLPLGVKAALQLGSPYQLQVDV